MKQVQISTATKIFRETDAILLAKNHLPNSENIRILSFGCSIGDELATLKTFFPKAKIFGCDINPDAIAIAQKSTGQLADIFMSSDESIAERGPFDLICAFSSLCINPLPKLDQFLQEFPYSYFQELIELLDKNLRPNGILALKNTSYPFTATPTFKHYHRIRSSQICQNGFIPVINPNGDIALTSIVPAPSPNTIFERGDLTGLVDWDFIDCVFQKKNDSQEPSRVINDNKYQRSDEVLTPLATWTRSNSDGQNTNKLSNHINFTTHYQTFSTANKPGQILTERTILRDSLFSPTPLCFESGNWWTP